MNEFNLLKPKQRSWIAIAAAWSVLWSLVIGGSPAAAQLPGPPRAPGDDRPAAADWLGIYSTPMSTRERAALKNAGVNGVVVVGVYPDSPAAQTGLRLGDVVVTVNGHEVTEIDQLTNWRGLGKNDAADKDATAKAAPAAEAVIVYQRDDVRWRVALQSIAPPADMKAATLKPAEAGQAWAQLELSGLLRSGSPPDVEGTRRWLQKAADQKLASAQASLGLMLLVGEGGPPDVKEGTRLLIAAGTSGLTSAQYTLGLIYLNGLGGVSQNYVAAAYWLHQAASQGHAPSQFMMACLHEEVSPPDHVGALYWLKQASEKGSPEANAMMSVFHRNGWGVTKSDADANRYLLAAANADHAPSQFLFGQVCAQGLGVEKDLETAFGWYRAAAKKGDVDAMNALGMCYKNGEGVAADPEEAKRWLEKAAAAGDGAAMFNRALFATTFEESVPWTKRAAHAGVAESQYFLGSAYQNGYGVPQSKTAATYWYKRAIAQGHEDAKLQYDSLFPK